MSDISITPANVLKSATSQLLTGICDSGVTVTAGQCIYIDVANLISLADSNGTPPANSISGIALNGASPGQPCDYVKLDAALVIGATLTNAAVLYLSNTAGGITATYADLASGTTVICLGVAISTTAFNFNPTVGGTKP